MTTRYHKNLDRGGVHTRCLATELNEDGFIACRMGLSLTLQQIAQGGGGIVERTQNGVVSQMIVHASEPDGSFKTETQKDGATRFHYYDDKGRLITYRSRRSVAKEDLPMAFAS